MVPQLSSHVLDHCKFLQLFPTINFYVAVALLFQFSLADLSHQPATALCRYMEQHYSTEALAAMLEKFAALFAAHTGIAMEIHKQ
jgi:hypothetical protein